MLKIIISPAKKMNLTDDYSGPLTAPVFLDRAFSLHRTLKDMTLPELKTLWKCSDKLAKENYERLASFSPERSFSPALLAYEGIQYQHIAPTVFTDDQWEYVSEHLRILSGFYGILRPTDSVIPYRLEMQAKLKTEHGNHLYDYWGADLYEELLHENMTELINLASGEYSKAVLPYISDPSEKSGRQVGTAHAIRCITCIFGELTEGKIKVKGTQAKIARGEMVRWMAQNQIRTAGEIQDFHELDYKRRKDLPKPDEYVFLRS